MSVTCVVKENVNLLVTKANCIATILLCEVKEVKFLVLDNLEVVIEALKEV